MPWGYYSTVILFPICCCTSCSCKVLICYIYSWRFACTTIPCFVNRALFLKCINNWLRTNQLQLLFQYISWTKSWTAEELDYDYWKGENCFFSISFDLALDTTSYLLNGCWGFLLPHSWRSQPAKLTHFALLVRKLLVHGDFHFFFFLCSFDPIPGRGLHWRGFAVTHIVHTTSVVLLWTSDQPDAQSST